jgi:hypothetical protein
MPRRRSDPKDRLPPYVYRRGAAYVIRAYDPDTQRQQQRRLCSASAPLSEVWQAYEAATQPTDHGTFRWLSRQFRESPAHAELAEKTRRDYADARRRICAMAMADGRLLGDLPLATWTPQLVAKWQDRRGAESPVVCNREKSYISRVFAWGTLRGHCESNPAAGVPRLKEHARTRYVTDDELASFAAFCADHPSGVYLVPLMELAYLLRARTAEVLDLTTDQISEDGVLLKRRKGSRDTISAWSPRLRAAVDAAEAAKRERGLVVKWLFAGKDRARLKESTVQTAFQRLMRLWSEQTGRERWSVHDLKAKGITDTANGDKLAASGHRDPKMLAIYDRLPGRVTATR